MNFANDLKYALRLLTKRPGFTLLTTAVMAIGIGLSVFLFSFINTVVFKDLPFEGGDSIVSIIGKNADGKNQPLDLHDFYEIRTNVRSMSEYSAYHSTSINVANRDGVRQYNGIAAEPNIFQLTRTKPLLGRAFTVAENQNNAERVIVIGYDMWQNQFGGSQNVINETARINGESTRIIGVMPQGFLFPNTAEYWQPLRADASKIARGQGPKIIGLAHINPGENAKEVSRQVQVVMQRLAQRYTKTNSGISAAVSTLQMVIVGEGMPVVYAMQLVAILILILASVNVGNLLFSRAVERGKETAIRVALGAPRSRLISQMLWESVLICVLGGVAGLLLLAWGLSITQSVTATFFIGKPSFWWQFGIDAYTIQVALIFIVATVLLTGLLPAWKNSGADFNAVLRDGTRGSLGKKAGRLNRFLVISEIFLSITVLIIAGVITAATYKTTTADNGATIDNILTGAIALPAADYDTPQKQVNFVTALQSRLQSQSSVGEVMISSSLPGHPARVANIAIEGREYAQDNQNAYPKANAVVISPGTLAKLAVELREGRYFDSSDEGAQKSTALVTDSFAKTHFGGQSAVGKRVRFVDPNNNIPQWLTIVGVVEHTNQGSAHQAAGKVPTVFRPYAQSPVAQLTVAMKMKGDEAAVTQALRDTLKSIDPELPAYQIKTYVDSVARFTAPLRFITMIFVLFGIAATILAASGIYGVMANTINQRTQEIGVKRALGATEKRISKEFMKSGIKQLLFGGIPGLLIGCLMGFAMSRVLDLGAGGLVVIAVSLTTFISGVVLFAIHVPTQRALDMEPNDALRYE